MRPNFIKPVKHKVYLNKFWPIFFIDIGFLAWCIWKYIMSKYELGDQILYQLCYQRSLHEKINSFNISSSKWKDSITTWDAEPRIIWSLKKFIINVIQIITFQMNPKLTNVTLGCTIFIFDVSIIYFTAQNYIRIW